MDDHEFKCVKFRHLQYYIYIWLNKLQLYKPHIIIIIIIVIFFIIIICLDDVMYFQCTSLSIHLYNELCITHCSEVIMSAMASQITGVSIVCSTVVPGVDQGKYQRPRHLPLSGESTGDRRIPLTKGQ